MLQRFIPQSMWHDVCKRMHPGRSWQLLGGSKMRRRIVPIIFGAVLIGGLVHAQGCIVNDGRSELEGESTSGTAGDATGGAGGTNFTTGGNDQGGTAGTNE